MPSLSRGSLALGVWCLLLWWPPHLTVSARGTTPNLKEIFVGRCWDYQRIVNPEPFTEGREKDCNRLWQLFSDAFMYKDSCNVTIESYDEFTEAAVHDVPRDKNLFWTGVFATVIDYHDVKDELTILEGTLIGYLGDNMQWCGKIEDPGVDMDSCPPSRTCQLAAGLSYWRAASQVFARHAEGVARVMLNGSNGHAYRNISTFANYELPNLNPAQVTELHALVVHVYDKPVKETCSNGTLLELKSIVEGMGMKYRCTDDPADIRYLMCVNDVDAPECKMISEILGHISGSDHVVPVSMVILLALAVLSCLRQ